MRDPSTPRHPPRCGLRRLGRHPEVEVRDRTAPPARNDDAVRLCEQPLRGVRGWEYADLLEAAGVDTVPELAQRNADNLHAKLGEINAAKEMVRRLPTAAQVSAWVEEAKTLPRMITH